MDELLYLLLGMAFGGAWGALFAWQITGRSMTHRFLAVIEALYSGDNIIRGDELMSRAYSAMRRGQALRDEVERMADELTARNLKAKER